MKASCLGRKIMCKSYCDKCGRCSRCGECCAATIPLTRKEEMLSNVDKQMSIFEVTND